jgi:hypothetical protein
MEQESTCSVNSAGRAAQPRHLLANRAPTQGIMISSLLTTRYEAVAVAVRPRGSERPTAEPDFARPSRSDDHVASSARIDQSCDRPDGSHTPVFPGAVAPKYASLKPSSGRMKTCLDQYRANKTANANGGMMWIQKGGGYFSACSKQLKSGTHPT